ncbi:MAG: hypothetical protein WD490_02015, partial [Opitutales bacterium]
PDEWIPPLDADHPRERRFARGTWDDDELRAVDLGDGARTQTIRLSLEPMELGLGEEPPFIDQPSWAERALNLRETLGPFALAYLETLLRAADGRGSKADRKTSPPIAVEEPHSPYPSPSSLTPEQRKLARALAEDGLSIQDRFRPEQRYKEIGKGHYESRTVEDIQEARRKKDEQS